MKYGFNSGIWSDAFVVPGIIADNLKISDGSYLKVILYLLRNNGKAFETYEIAEALDLSEDVVIEALIFWKQFKILPDDNNELPEVNNIFAVPELLPEPNPEQVSEYNKKNTVYSSSGLNLTPDEISDMLKSTPVLYDLFIMAEKYIDNVNFAVQRSLVWMYQYLGLPIDVIITLISYCASVNKSYVFEIDSLAYTWRKNGIDTLELAQNEVNRLKDDIENKSFITKIKRMFNMGRDPVPKQRDFIINWKNQHYPDELIECAYYKAVEQTGNPIRLPIEYIDTILKSWSEKGIKTLEQAEQDNTDFKKLFKSKKKNVSEFSTSDDEHFEEDYAIFLNNF